MSAETIVEFVAVGRGKVSRERGLIRGVKILGLESANGRTYTGECVKRAVKLYEGVAVNINHPPRGKETETRRYQDRIGRLQSVQADSGLRGDLHINPHHPLAEQLFWDAENAPENVGLSHNVEAKTSRKGGKVIVEEILRVQSVDLVADPATTTGLFESADAKAAMVQRVAGEIGVPQQVLDTQTASLALMESEEQTRVFLTDVKDVLRKLGQRFRRPRSIEQRLAEGSGADTAPTDGKSFAALVTGRRGVTEVDPEKTLAASVARKTGNGYIAPKSITKIMGEDQ